MHSVAVREVRDYYWTAGFSKGAESRQRDAGLAAFAVACCAAGVACFAPGINDRTAAGGYGNHDGSCDEQLSLPHHWLRSPSSPE
jgi:hypothetical protein